MYPIHTSYSLATHNTQCIQLYSVNSYTFRILSPSLKTTLVLSATSLSVLRRCNNIEELIAISLLLSQVTYSSLRGHLTDQVRWENMKNRQTSRTTLDNIIIGSYLVQISSLSFLALPISRWTPADCCLPRPPGPTP